MNDNQGRLTSLLKQESTALESLYAVLMKELVALKERNSESIISLSKEKNNLLNNLENLDRERQLCLQDKAQINTPVVSDEINQLSNEIEICLSKCKKQNSINGGIIEVSKLFNEKMLDIICGNTKRIRHTVPRGKITWIRINIVLAVFNIPYVNSDTCYH